MYKEVNNNKSNIFGLIIVFVVSLAIVYSILSYIPIFPLAKDIFVLVIMGLFVIYLLKNRLSSYEYELCDEQIIISTILGNRISGQAQIKYSGIELFCEEQKCDIQCETKTFCTSNSRKYAIVFTGEKGKIKIIFAPTDKLVSLLKDKIRED